MQGESEEGGEGVGGQPPIIIKKVIAAAGHHGGAWKVAFADFVTAMMALFMVLWLMNVNQETQEAVAAYFNDPKGFGEELGSGKAGSGGGLYIGEQDLEGLAARIEEAMSMPQFEALKDQVVSTVTAEGLRIELLENENGTFFNSGSPQPSSSGRQTLSLIAAELEKLPNEVIMEGHTDSRPFHGRRNYSNWELSADRANSARRILIEAGLPTERIVQVRGFADVALRKPEAPDDASNRRISLIVRYSQERPPADAEAASGEAPAESELAPEGPQPREPDPTEAAHVEPGDEDLPEDLSVFGRKEARKMLKRYRKKGPDKATKLLIEAISSHKNGDTSLLDVGGGVGAIQIAMLNHGVAQATNVDASPAYHLVAKEQAARQGIKERISYQQGDFVDIAPQLAAHDIVSMDKVICCYPDAKELIDQAAQHSKHLVALVYPHDTWLARVISAVANLFIKLRYRNFRIYIHSNTLVAGILKQHDFRQVHRASTFISQVMVWEKTPGVPA